MTGNHTNKMFMLEMVWILLTVVLILLILLPIQSQVGDAYPFYFENIAVIAIAVTLIRYIFLLKYHWVSSAKWIKVIFIFLPIPIFFFLTGAFYDFQAFSDEVGLQSIMTDLPYKEQTGLAKYIRNEIVLFWAAAFIANLYMPIRMILSLWREINKGTH